MKTAINFRAMEETLNDCEFNQFLAKLFQTVPKRETITKSLYHLLAYECHTNQNDYTQQITQTMRTIIDLKKSKQKQMLQSIKLESDDSSTENEPVLFSDIPQILVSEIGSYLSLTELLPFFKCNRNIYVSCKSTPSTLKGTFLKCLSKYVTNYGEAAEHYQLMKLKQFKMVQNIRPEFGAFRHWIWPNINRLRLVGIITKTSMQNSETHSSRMYHVRPSTENYTWNTGQLINMLENTRINILESVRLHCHQTDKSSIPAIWNAICGNKSIRCLSINELNFLSIAETNPICGLKGLRVAIPAIRSYMRRLNYTQLFPPKIIYFDKICSNTMAELQSIRIESVDIDDVGDVEFKLNGKMGGNVKEIYVENVNPFDLEQFVRSGIGLQRMQWVLHSLDNYENVLKRILTGISLNYLFIDNKKAILSIKSVLDPILDILQSNMQKRCNLKLEFNLNSEKDFVFMENNLSQIVKRVASVIRSESGADYMVIFNVYDGIIGIPGNKEAKFIQLSSPLIRVAAVMDSNKTRIVKIVASNKDNTMCGYAEKWIF